MAARSASRRMSLDPRVLAQQQQRSTGNTSSSASAASTAAGSSSDTGNVRVICRFRPVKPNEMVNGRAPAMPFDINKRTGTVTVQNDNREFVFDEVFGTETTQAEIFESVRYTLEGVLEGINGTILTYGQTSSGKTFTMEGPSMWDPQMQGVIPRAVERLFQLIAEADVHTAFTVKVSYFEIYCEKIRDLLNPANVNLKTREDKDEGIVVSGITEVYVANKEDIMEVLETGKRFRASAPTLMNAESSRSHSLLSIHVTQRNEVTQRVRRGKLVLVDLAGSEKVSKTGAAGLRLEEAKNINRSLTTLGMVITALTDNAHNHVPYRDSKLTRVLQESLGGNSKTCLVICCAPEPRHAPETVSTLRFGESAKKIKNHVHVNEELGVIELKAMLERANREIERLRRQLAGEMPADEDTSTASIAPESATPSSPINFLEPLPVEGLLRSTCTPREDEEQDSEATMLRLRIAELEAELDVEREKSRWERDSRIQTAAQEAALQKVVQTLEAQVIDLRKSLEQANAAVAAANESALAGVGTRPVSWRMRTRSRSRSYQETASSASALMSELEQLSEHGDVTTEGSQRARSRSQVSVLSPLPEEGPAIDTPPLPVSPISAATADSSIVSTKSAVSSSLSSLSSSIAPTPTATAPAPAQMEEVHVDDVVISHDKFQEMKQRMQQLEQLFEQELGMMEEQLEQREQDLEQAKQDILDLEKELSEARNQHEATVQMLMAKLAREQEHRTRLSTRLDLYEQQHAGHQSEKDREHERTFFERWLGTGSKHSEKEFQRLQRDMQKRLDTITALQEEMAAQKEAHSVVLQTKEHILHSLLEQNTALVRANENLTRIQADQEHKIEELLAALRSMDTTPRGSSRPDSIRRPRLGSGDGLASPDSHASDDTAGSSSHVIHTIHGHAGGVITSIRGGGGGGGGFGGAVKNPSF